MSKKNKMDKVLKNMEYLIKGGMSQRRRSIQLC